jgi:REP element-mobilizing transposase RayT
MVRGLERRIIFRDDTDRGDFIARLAHLAERGGLIVYAWALLPNHAHLLVRTGNRSLARNMRSLLTGYAGAFNRRHKRAGHLFQNRYRSIVVEEETYLLELVRYLHLNPLRAGIVASLHTLNRYPWTGHSALLGTVVRPWQDTQNILTQFGFRVGAAQRAYRDFVTAGAPLGRRPEFQGGGLVRSHGGWAAVIVLRRGREAYLADERILGSSEFVETVRESLQATARSPRDRRPLADLIAGVCAVTGCSPTALRQGSRIRAVAHAREGIAYLALEIEGYPGRMLAEPLGVHQPSVYKAAQRGRAAASEWEGLLGIESETRSNVP